MNYISRVVKLLLIILISNFIFIACQSKADNQPVDPYIPQPDEPILDPCPNEDAEINILFIGNSLSNAVPNIVKYLADSAGKSIFVDEVILFGRSLDYIAVQALTAEKVNSRSWDYVVLQASGFITAYPETHGEIYPAYGTRTFEEPFIDLKNMVMSNAACSRIIFFMPWGWEDGITWLEGQTDTFEDMQQHIYNNSINFCNQQNFLNAPIGWAWYLVMQEREEIDLFMPDMTHATYAGSYLAACVIFNVVFRESLNDNLFNFNLDPEDAMYLRNKSSTLVLDNLDLWNIN